jgi:hypothetical protein
MSGLREAFDEIVADVPVYGALDRAIEQADRERRHRNGRVAGLAAAAVVVAVIVGALAITRDGSDSQRPIGPSTPTEKTTQTTAPANAMVNGRIQDIEDYLTRARPACDDCYVEGGAFNQDTGTLLVTSRRRDVLGGPVGISVVGADGLHADLSCPGDFACRTQSGAETLGPGADELTVSSSDGEVQVIGYDGTVRRTIDLSAVLDESSEVGDLAWSPDGSRLAVITSRCPAPVGGTCPSEFSSDGRVAHVWLVDRDGGDPQRVHTASYTGPLGGKHPLAYIWSLEWSPDGRRLGFIEELARLGGVEESLSIRAVSLLLPEPGQEGPGTAMTLYDYATRHPSGGQGPRPGARAVGRGRERPGPAPLRVHHVDRVLLPAHLAREAVMSHCASSRSRPCPFPAVRAGATPVLLLRAPEPPGMDKAPGQETWGFDGARGGS